VEVELDVLTELELTDELDTLDDDRELELEDELSSKPL